MRRTTYVCAAFAIVLGASVLVVGWVFDVEPMRRVGSGKVNMKASTALMFMLAGVALALLAGRPTPRRRAIAAGCATGCVGLATAFLCEYVVGVDFGIDELVFRDDAAHARGLPHPGRPAPTTVIGFILIGSALLALDARRRVVELLVAPVGVIGAICLIGYLYEIPLFTGPASAARMAINTGLGFLLLSIGIVLARPSGRLQAFLTTEAPGGIMARTLLPIAIVVPLAAGWLHLVAEQTGVMGPHAAAWWQTAAMIASLVLIISIAARGLNRAVRAADHRFETAFEDAPIGIALVDLTGRVMKVNRSLCELTGYDSAELAGVHVTDVIHPDDRDSYAGAVAGLLDPDSGGYTAERRYVKRGGSVMYGRHSATLVRDESGEPVNFIVQVQDITQEREIDRIREEFVSVVTHELRTPLTSVAGYLDIVLEEDEDNPPLDPQHARHVAVARRNAQRLIDLVEDLLLVRRLEAGREQLSPALLDLSELAADRLESVAPMASAKDIAIGGDVAPGVVVDADPRRIAQVVDNLLSNAIKYTPVGGRVRLELSNGGDRVTLAVSDSGIGIPESEQAQLFDPFFRASNVSNSAVPGTGLGLVVTRRLIEAHGGRLTFESTEGFGSKFTVTLPVG